MHLFRILVCILILLTASCSSPQSAVEKPERPSLGASPAPGTKYVTIIGDGFSVGPGKTGADPEAWPRLIQQLLASRGLTIEPSIYASISSGYVDHDRGGKKFQDFLRRLVGTNTNLLVIFGGDRDTTALPYGTHLTESIRATLRLAKECGPRARLLIIGPASISPPSPSLLQVRDVVREEATASGALFVDPLAERWIQDTPGLAGDLRLNASGQKYLADKIAPLLVSQLQAGP